MTAGRRGSWFKARSGVMSGVVLARVDGQQIQVITRGLMAANGVKDLIPLQCHDVE